MSSFDWSNPTVVRLLNRYTTLNRKAIPDDAEQSRVVREVAEYYAANYEGSFDFMLSMRKAFDTWNSLTVKQASATINCLLAEYKRNQAAPQAKPFVYPTAELPNLPAEIATGRQQGLTTAPTATPVVSIREMPIKARCSRCGELSNVSYDTSLTALCIDKAACDARCNTPVVPQCKNGTYTIVLDETGDYRTVKLTDAPESYNKPQGTQIAAYLSGSDNEKDYKGFAFVQGTQIKFWTAFNQGNPTAKALVMLLTTDSETQIDLGTAYAIESSRCWRCNRKLTVPASLHRGVGPECAKQLGIK